MIEYKNALLCGDTLSMLQALPDATFDAGVTSPPYNKQENKKGWLVKNVAYDTACDKQEEAAYQENQIAVLTELYRVMKAGSSFFYNHKIRMEKGVMLHPFQWLTKTPWCLRQEIIWDRMIAANIRGWRFWQTDERIYWLYKPIDKHLIGKEILSKHALLTSIWRFSPERNNPHPAPFPIELPTRCLYSVLNDEPSCIIDPYAGSGTTLVAAKILNYTYTGIDISSQYCGMAEKRLQNITTEYQKVTSELEKHIVHESFSEKKEKGKFTGRFNPNLVQPLSQPDFFTTAVSPSPVA